MVIDKKRSNYKDFTDLPGRKLEQAVKVLTPYPRNNYIDVWINNSKY